MNEADFTLCAYCPRLCRHVCPAAVGTGREAAVPSVLMTAPLLVAAGTWTLEEGLDATRLCLDCGACTRHCRAHVPLGEHLARWRAAAGAGEQVGDIRIEGDTPLVAVFADDDWRASVEGAYGTLAACRSRDSLGYAAFRAGASVLDKVREAFAGRRILTASGEVETVATAAGIPVERLPAPEGQRYVTCHEGAVDRPEQLSCCGRHAGFAEREPEAAAEIANENVRRMAGGSWTCADEGCADWLRRHGADIRGPVPRNGGADG